MTMEIDRTRACRSTRTRRRQIRPRIFLEGNFFVDIHPGSPSAPKLGDGDTIPVNQTSAAGPARPDPHLAAVRHAHEPAGCCSTSYSAALQPPGRRRLQRLDPVLGAGLRDTARSSTDVDARPAPRTTSAASSATPARWPTRSTATRRSCKSLITDFNRTAARVRRATQSASSSAIAELPRTLRAGGSGARRAQRRLPGRCARFVRDAPPGRHARPARRIDASLPFVTPAARPRARRRSCAAWSPTSSRPSRRSTSSTARRRRCYEQVRAASSCQNEVILPWTQAHRPRPELPGRAQRVSRRRTKPLVGLSGEGRSADAERPLVPRPAGRRRATSTRPRQRAADDDVAAAARHQPGQGQVAPPLRPDVPARRSPCPT